MQLPSCEIGKVFLVSFLQDFVSCKVLKLKLVKMWRAGVDVKVSDTADDDDWETDADFVVSLSRNAVLVSGVAK